MWNTEHHIETMLLFTLLTSVIAPTNNGNGKKNIGKRRFSGSLVNIARNIGIFKFNEKFPKKMV